MPFQPAPGIAQLVPVFSFQTSTMMNVLHARVGNPAGQQDLDDIATAYYDWWDEYHDNLFLQAVTLVEVRVRDLSFETGLSIVAPNVGAPTGGLAYDPLPAFNTPCVSLHTGFAGQSYNGRLYHVGIGEGHQADGLIDSTYTLLLRGAYEVLRDALIAAGHRLVVLSRVQEGVVMETAVGADITTVSIDRIVDCQRRRKRGVGM